MASVRWFVSLNKTHRDWVWQALVDLLAEPKKIFF